MFRHFAIIEFHKLFDKKGIRNFFQTLRDVNEKLSRNVVQQVRSHAPIEQQESNPKQSERSEQNKQKASDNDNSKDNRTSQNLESSRDEPAPEEQQVEQQKRETQEEGGVAEDVYEEEEFEGSDEPGTVRESIERWWPIVALVFITTKRARTFIFV